MRSSHEDTLIYNTSAIVLRRMDYGDHDSILTLLTREKGKISVMAKNAKKSVKRFSGTLELFYVIELVIRENLRMAYMMEASVEEAFETIRSDILKTAYASYWAETVIQFMEEGVRQEGVYSLLVHSLMGLDLSLRPAEEWSIYFQLKFLELSGHAPELSHCQVCETDVDEIDHIRIRFDIKQGGLVCNHCGGPSPFRIDLSKGTIKQLIWFQKSEPGKASMVRFSKQALNEGLGFLEVFLAFHLEKELRSLKFLKKIRN
ncbi:MAG: DNA repair protein RecO [Proteobacteria bacterium]|nr:DNA repair protein RecO [Pseudomonadota bacterium]